MLMIKRDIKQQDFTKSLTHVILSNLNNFHLLEVVNRVRGLVKFQQIKNSELKTLNGQTTFTHPPYPFFYFFLETFKTNKKHKKHTKIQNF